MPKTKGNRARVPRKRSIRFKIVARNERVSKTHTNDIIAAGKAVAKWIASRSGAVAGYDVRERINQRYPNYATSDKVGIMHGAMAVLRGKDPDTFRQYANYQASIKHDKVD